MPNDLKLIYLEQDPATQRAKQLLQQLGLNYQEVPQDGLEPSDFYLSYTSPTLLDGSRIIFGEKSGASCGAPTESLPNLDELRKRLER